MVNINKQKEFTTYAKANNIDPTKLTQTDASEYMQTGSINLTGKTNIPTANQQADNLSNKIDKAFGTENISAGIDNPITTGGNGAENQNKVLNQQREELNKSRGINTPKEENKQPIDTTISTNPQTTTDITYNEDKTPYNPNEVINKAPIFNGGDGKQYQTVRNKDNTLTTIDVATGEAVTGKYTDDQRDSIKQGFLDGQENIDLQKQLEDPNFIYSQLLAGETITDDIKQTQGYKKAYNRKIDYDKYSSMDSSELALIMANGELLPGTPAYNDVKANNPGLLQEAESMNKLNIVNSGTKSNVEQSISDYITKMMNPVDKKSFATIVSENEDIKTLRASLSGLVTERDELLDQIQNVEDDVTSDLGNKSVSKSYKNALVYERSKNLTRLANLKIAEVNSLGGQLQNITADLKYSYEQGRQDDKDNLAKFQTAYNVYKDQTSDERALELAKQKQILQSGDLDSTDEFTRNTAITNAVNQLYSLYPIPGMESPTLKIQKVKDRIAQGMTPQEAIKSLEDEIRGTQRYKDMISGETPKTGTRDIKKVGDRTFALNQDGSYEDITKKTPTIANTGNGNITQEYGATSPVKADNVKLANGLVGTPGIDIDGAIGDDITSFTNGTVVAVHEANESGGFGRRVIIKDEEGRMHVYNHLDTSNLNEGETVTKGQVIAKMGNTGTVIKGEGGDGSHLDYRVSDNGNFALNGGNWIDPKQFMGEGEEGGFSQEVQDIGQAILRGERKISDLSGKSNEVLKRDVINYTSTNKPVYDDNSDVIIGLTDRIGVLDKILKDEGLLEDVSGARRGHIANFFTSQNSQVLKNFQFLLDQEGLQNLIKLKAQGATFGSLTEKEMSTLRNSASLLNSSSERDKEDNIIGFDMSDKEFITNLKDFNTTLKKAKTNLMGGESTGGTPTGGRIKKTTGGRIK